MNYLNGMLIVSGLSLMICLVIRGGISKKEPIFPFRPFKAPTQAEIQNWADAQMIAAWYE